MICALSIAWHNYRRPPTRADSATRTIIPSKSALLSNVTQTHKFLYIRPPRVLYGGRFKIKHSSRGDKIRNASSRGPYLWRWHGVRGLLRFASDQVMVYFGFTAYCISVSAGGLRRGDHPDGSNTVNYSTMFAPRAAIVNCLDKQLRALASKPRNALHLCCAREQRKELTIYINIKCICGWWADAQVTWNTSIYIRKPANDNYGQWRWKSTKCAASTRIWCLPVRWEPTETRKWLYIYIYISELDEYKKHLNSLYMDYIEL